jgi:hypothetical protein
VTQVCLGQFQVQVHFSEKARLSIEGRFVHEIAECGEQIVGERESLTSGNRLERLLAKSVVEARVPTNGTVALLFSNHDRLILFDDSEQYESYQINSPEGILVV